MGAMKHPRVLGSLVCLTLGLAAPLSAAPAAPSKVIKVGTRPESVTRGFGGKYFISVMNGDVPGDGGIKVLEGEEARDFASGMDEPKGLCFTGKHLVVSDRKRVWRVDEKGEKTELAAEAAFPHPPSFLNDVGCEPGGKAVYVTDMGANTKMRDPQKKLWPLDSAEAKALPAIGRVYRITTDGKISIAVDSRPDLPCPNGVTAPARNRLYVTEFFTGTVFDARGKGVKPIVTGLRGADGVEEAGPGVLYVSSWELGKVWRVRPGKGTEPKELTVIAEGYQSAADFYLDKAGKQILLPDMKAGTLSFIPLD